MGMQGGVHDRPRKSCDRAFPVNGSIPVCLQRDMLEDHKRTGAYFNAVMQNREQFQGKVVLDVGTG